MKWVHKLAIYFEDKKKSSLKKKIILWLYKACEKVQYYFQFNLIE